MFLDWYSTIFFFAIHLIIKLHWLALVDWSNSIITKPIKLETLRKCTLIPLFHVAICKSIIKNMPQDVCPIMDKNGSTIPVPYEFHPIYKSGQCPFLIRVLQFLMIGHYNWILTHCNFFENNHKLHSLTQFPLFWQPAEREQAIQSHPQFNRLENFF